jgi:hypothetical protein
VLSQLPCCRSITGSPQGYHYSLGQEYTANVADSLSRSGEELIKRSLSLSPIISIDSQEPVKVQLELNSSLMSPPLVVHK